MAQDITGKEGTSDDLRERWSLGYRWYRSKNPRTKNFAANTRADLVRADWADFQRMYQPVEDMLLRRMTSGYQGEKEAAQAQALSEVNQSFANQQESTERRLKGFGLEMTPGQRASMNRQLDVQAALAGVEAANRTGRNMEGLRTQIMGGGLTRGLSMPTTQPMSK